MANIKDVAELAGVSITTVSHVINQTRYVSDELTQRVYDAMEELNYHPNTLARSLRSGRTKTIGLLIPDISNFFFAEISRKIEDRGFDRGYSVVLCNTDDNSKKEQIYINLLLEKQVDGIIFISSGDSKTSLSKPINLGIPIVVADRDVANIHSDIVLLDNFKAGYDATKYLLALNHTRIGCISGPSLLTPSAQRVEGYRQALRESGIKVDEELIQMGDFRFSGGEEAMCNILAISDQPTAVFVCNDMMALGANKAINDSGKKVPEDYSLIGFDNIPLSKSFYPALTTMSQPIQKMAELTIDLLLEKIDLKLKRKRDSKQPLEYQRIILKAELIERDSCKVIKK